MLGYRTEAGKDVNSRENLLEDDTKTLCRKACR